MMAAKPGVFSAVFLDFLLTFESFYMSFDTFLTLVFQAEDPAVEASNEDKPKKKKAKVEAAAEVKEPEPEAEDPPSEEKKKKKKKKKDKKAE